MELDWKLDWIKVKVWMKTGRPEWTSLERPHLFRLTGLSGEACPGSTRLPRCVGAEDA